MIGFTASYKPTRATTGVWRPSQGMIRSNNLTSVTRGSKADNLGSEFQLVLHEIIISLMTDFLFNRAKASTYEDVFYAFYHDPAQLF